jgi:2'-hydroxyisoflavone reductase
MCTYMCSIWTERGNRVKILILGGLSFLGRHLVERGLGRGHDVTVFTRGLHDPGGYPRIERLTGDRDGNLTALEGKFWDVAIDTSGYVPRVVRASAALLAPAVDHCTFVSSMSVYADPNLPGLAEGAELIRLEDPTVEEILPNYGGLKVLCEQAVEEELPGRTLIVRPGLIVGRYDPSDRFTYWPHRVARGGEILSPERPEVPVQIVDAQDLADWMIRMAETRDAGIYNATGPDYSLTIGQVLDESKRVSGSDATFTWVPAEFLAEQKVQPWQDLPAWIPDIDEFRGFSRMDCSRAIAAGLTFRPLADTVRDTLNWARTFEPDHEWRAGLSPRREHEVLEAWRVASVAQH